VKRVVKLADTLVSAFIVTVQLPIPLHAPPQPARPQAAAAPAVKVTCVPGTKLALHVAPQSIAEGELVTLPPGLPATDTESIDPAPVSLKTTPHSYGGSAGQV
jgi:hypothetical protein